MIPTLEMAYTTGIQDLPLELIQEIVLRRSSKRWDETPRKSVLKTLRQISRPFKHAADPTFFSEITFDFVKRTLGSVLDQLNDLATQTTPASKYTRTLDIQSIGILNLQNANAHNAITHEQYGILLLRAVKALHNVRSVRLNLGISECMYSILDGLGELRRLDDLDLNFFFFPKLWQTPDLISLHRFGNLRSIKIRGEISPEVSDSLVLQLRQKQPSLEVLEYDVSQIRRQQEDGPGSFSGECLLHDVVKGIPKASPLKLKHLLVNGWSLRLDSTTLPHLRRLTHLDIRQYEGKHHQLAQMWEVLNHESIRLQSIRTDTFSEPFISYLLSYYGLEDLRMIWRAQGVIHGSNLQEIVSDLYTLALPNHKDTLKIFEDLNGSDIARCVSPEHMISMQRCHKLEKLRVTINQAELDLREKIQETLASALNIPSLYIIEVDLARPPMGLIGRTQYKAYLSRHEAAKQKIMNIVNSLDIQRTINRDLTSCLIIVGHRRYKVKSGKKGLHFSQSEGRAW